MKIRSLDRRWMAGTASRSGARSKSGSWSAWTWAGAEGWVGVGSRSPAGSWVGVGSRSGDWSWSWSRSGSRSGPVFRSWSGSGSWSVAGV